MATCWTSAGDAASDRADLRSPLPLRERIEAASAAGFRGFGLLSDDLPAAVAEYRLTGIRAMLADNGIVHLELEGIPFWWDDGPHREESDRVRREPARGGGGARRPAHQGHPRRRRRPMGPRALGREVRRARRPGAGCRRPAGDRVLPLVEHQDSARRPAARRRRRTRCGRCRHRHLAHRPRAHADRRPRVGAAGPHHRCRTERRRRAGGRDAVRGHGASSPVLRGGRIRPARP